MTPLSAIEALRDLLELAEEENLDASVGDEKFAVIVRAREVLRLRSAEQARRDCK